MWKLTGNPKTQRVTRQLATQFAEMDPAPHDRPLSENRLLVYQKVVKEGGFRPVQWAKAFCHQTGQEYRVNGKHTSTLFSGLDPLPELYCVIEVYECDTLEDVSRLYSTYDSNIQSRSAADIYLSFASCVPQIVQANIAPKTICLAASAIHYADRQDGYKQMRPTERAEALLENSDFLIWLKEIVANGATVHRNLKRLPVFAAMYATRHKSKADATKFWTQVRDETATTPDDPTRKLAKFLTACLLNKGVSLDHRGVRRGRVSEREYFVKCIHSWNAWRRGESTKLTYYASAEIPDIR